MGLRLTILRSRAECSTNWANQVHLSLSHFRAVQFDYIHLKKYTLRAKRIAKKKKAETIIIKHMFSNHFSNVILKDFIYTVG